MLMAALALEALTLGAAAGRGVGRGRDDFVPSCTVVGRFGRLATLQVLLLSLLARLLGRFGSGGGSICAADGGEGFPATPGWRCGRWLAGEACGVRKLSRAASSRCVFGAPCAGHTWSDVVRREQT